MGGCSLLRRLKCLMRSVFPFYRWTLDKRVYRCYPISFLHKRTFSSGKVLTMSAKRLLTWAKHLCSLIFWLSFLTVWCIRIVITATTPCNPNQAAIRSSSCLIHESHKSRSVDHNNLMYTHRHAFLVTIQAGWSFADG